MKVTTAPGSMTTPSPNRMNRCLAVALLGFLTVLVSVPSFSKEEKIIPSETCRGLWIVPLTFGEQTLDVVLDTGAKATHLDPESLERLRGAPVEPGKKYTLRDGRIGPLRVNRIRVNAHDLDHLGRALGRDIDGILGMSTFHTVLLTLDYEKEEVRVEKGRLPRVDGRAIFRDAGSKRPMLLVDVGGRKEKVLIDSGSSGQFDLVPDERLDWAVEPRPVNGAARFRTIEIDEVGRMAGSLRFGPATFEEPIVERADRISLAGYEALRHFVWTFDRKSKRMRIRPLSSEPIRMESRRGLGAAFSPLPEGFEVIQVFPDTPAEAAGLTQGDLVTHQDGVPMGERNCVGAAGDLGKESVRLTVRRGDATRDIDIAVSTLVP